MKTEGVVTAVPGSSPPVRAARYTSIEQVPILMRFNAKQIGSAGYWYVALPDTPGEAWDKLTGKLWTAADSAADTVNETLGAEHGALGIFSKLFGIPYPLSVLLVIFIGFALLRGAGLVPPIRGIFK